MSAFGLAGKRALITGSTRGIGFALAKALAGAGAEIILNGRDAEALGAASAELADAGVKVRGVAFDVTSRDSVEEAVTWIEDEAGPIDILVNNAGMQHRAPLEDFPADKFEQVIATNLTSVFTVGQLVARRMIQRKAGKIINIASLQVEFARASTVAYAASKAGVANLTRAMATEWGRHGINVNGIAPGYINTEMNAALLADPKFNAWVESRTPMGRWGEPSELGGAAVFLASEAAAFVSGHILYVDGAFSATM
ncbi:MAG: glucose 1-dehydrogenase [Devosia sp.]